MRWRKDRYESQERDILIEGAIMGLAINLALEKRSQEYTRITPAKNLSNRGEGA